MNINRIVIAGLLLFAGTQALCQTSVIAHRSHSGGMETFSAAGGDNFGMPPKHIDSVARLSDTSTIEFSNYGTDTVYNGGGWNDPRLGLDSLRRAFPRIKFIGFEAREEAGHADRLPASGPGSRMADAPGGRHDQAGLLLLLCAVAAPSLAYGLWRAETCRKG